MTEQPAAPRCPHCGGELSKVFNHTTMRYRICKACKEIVVVK